MREVGIVISVYVLVPVFDVSSSNWSNRMDTEIDRIAYESLEIPGIQVIE